jgi:hypothetical protein
MIRWRLEKLGIELSLDVQDCDTLATLQIKPLIEPDFTALLQRELAGLYRLRGGVIGPSLNVNAIELRKALNSGLPQYWPKLVDGIAVYQSYVPKPFPPGVKP